MAVTDSVQRFISELIRAASEVDKLTPLERARLLRRAAGTIREYQRQSSCSAPPGNGSRANIVRKLTIMAATIDFVMPEQVSSALLKAVEAIEAAQVSLRAKGQVEADC